MRLIKPTTISAAIIILLSLMAGIGAYLTAYDDCLNEFTVGDVQIELTEPLFSQLAVNERALLPSDDVVKDPQVTNTGENDVFIFVKLEMPMEELVTADASTGHKQPKTMRELFEFTANPNWRLVECRSDSVNKVRTYVYAYTAGGPVLNAIAAGQTTSSVFDNMDSLGGKPGLHIINMLEGSINVNEVLLIPITAYGIQTDDLGVNNSRNSNDVWQIIRNQIGS